MRLIPGIKDIRGKESVTLFFVAVSWAALTVKFFFGGIVTPFGTMPVVGAGEFGIATAAILAIWLGREWTEKGQQKYQAPPTPTIPVTPPAPPTHPGSGIVSGGGL